MPHLKSFGSISQRVMKQNSVHGLSTSRLWRQRTQILTTSWWMHFIDTVAFLLCQRLSGYEGDATNLSLASFILILPSLCHDFESFLLKFDEICWNAWSCGMSYRLPLKVRLGQSVKNSKSAEVTVASEAESAAFLGWTGHDSIWFPSWSARSGSPFSSF